MEIINFIHGTGKLFTAPILTEFREVFASQNAGILGTDAFQFAKLYNDDVTLIEDNNYIVRQHSILVYIQNGSHMFYLYRNPSSDVLEKWDPSSWQHTSNNCTLYSALIAIIRPITSFEETKHLLHKIIDAQGSEGAKILSEISLHFFARGISYFRYSSSISSSPISSSPISPSILSIPPVPQIIQSEVKNVLSRISVPPIIVFIHGILPDSYYSCVDSFKHFYHLCEQNQIPFTTYYRTYTISKDEKKCETFDLENEFTRFCSQIPDSKIILVGHSYGGVVANAFNKMLGNRCIGSISLDGCEFWLIWPILVKNYITNTLKQSFDEHKLKFTPESIIYNEKKLDISKIVKTPQLYNVTYKHSYTIQPNHVMIQYKYISKDMNSELNYFKPEDVNIEHSHDEHYSRPVYNLYYGTEKNHTMHANKKVSKEIYNRFINEIIDKQKTSEQNMGRSLTSSSILDNTALSTSFPSTNQLNQFNNTSMGNTSMGNTSIYSSMNQSQSTQSTSPIQTLFYSSHFQKESFYKSSPILVVFTHGLLSCGRLYSDENFNELISLCDKNKISNCLYYRNGIGTNYNHTEEIYNVEFEYTSFIYALQQFYKRNNVNEAMADKIKYIFVGHSFGAIYASLFSNKMCNKCIKSISLDGSDFYEFVPYLIKQALSISVIDDEKINTTIDKVEYNNSIVPLYRVINKSVYQFIYLNKDNTNIDKHYIIDYYDNKDAYNSSTYSSNIYDNDEDETNEDNDDSTDESTNESKEPPPKLVTAKSKHYKHIYELHYGKKYNHTIHTFSQCAKLIFDKFIK